MSKHSKNNTSSSVFTYMERQKLKSAYGTHHSRIGQDSIKSFQMCTICNHRLIEPTACNEGHTFCHSCVIEYLVKQKRKIAQNQEEIQKFERRNDQQKHDKDMEKEVKKLEQFEKYDGFFQITEREKLNKQEVASQRQPWPDTKITQQDVKPIGIYELNPMKEAYVKTAFWTLESAPMHVQKVENESTVVYCPGGKHKLALKKLRPLTIKQLEKQYSCWICGKEIKRQRVGAYKCGHVVCISCKSDKCQICQQGQGWLQIENSASSYAAHNKAEVKTYSHAFVG